MWDLSIYLISLYPIAPLYWFLYYHLPWHPVFLYLYIFVFQYFLFCIVCILAYIFNTWISIFHVAWIKKNASIEPRTDSFKQSESRTSTWLYDSFINTYGKSSEICTLGCKVRNTQWRKWIYFEQALWNELFIWTDLRKWIITESCVENGAWLFRSCMEKGHGQSLIKHDCVYNYYCFGGSHRGMMLCTSPSSCRQMHGSSGQCAFLRKAFMNLKSCYIIDKMLEII